MVSYLVTVEKLKPSLNLNAIKSAFSNVEKLRATGTALRGAASLGFGRTEIVGTIQTMQARHFYKSMTAYNDHRAWQDVYHVPSPAGILYVKLSGDGLSEFLLLSFKEKGDD